MSKIINNFQGRESAILIKSPISGIDSNSIDNPQSAKYIQNMLLGEDNNLCVRNGTKLVSKYNFDNTKYFREQLKLMEYINLNGNSEILIYQNYISKLLYVDCIQNLTIAEIVGFRNKTKIEIDISTFTADNKNYLKRIIFEGLYVYINQETLSNGADISDVLIEENKITFTIPFPIDFFDIDTTDIFESKNAFDLWIERSAIYKFLNTNKLEIPILLKDDLNPNVIVSYINYQNNLIICNGIDPVFYYNGNTLSELLSDYTIVVSQITAINDNTISITTNLNYELELGDKLKNTNKVVITNDAKNSIEYIITNVVFTVNPDNLKIDITLNNNLIGRPLNISYKKEIPHFSYINVINDRLFALDAGGSFFKKFRSPDKSMLVYYCSKRKSIFEWYNKAGFIEAINLASNSNKTDDLQCFNTYQGRILFWGKESVQIWTGSNPSVINDGQNIEFGDLKWEKTEPVGIFHKNMYVELPNTFIFLSKFGICKLKIDGFNNLNIDLFFAESINNYVKKELEDLKNEREYRSLNCFLYPYGGFLGFRFPHNSYIYQLKNNGYWTIFTQSFSGANSFLYDSVSKNLYLSSDKGVLVYCDKLENKNYLDFEENPIFFDIHYNWLNVNNTWYNDNVYIACSSYEKIPIEICLFINFNNADCKMVNIDVNQINSKYDYSLFKIDKYSYNDDGIYPQETFRFHADSFMLRIKGIAYNEFNFDSIYLSGGINNGNRDI